MFAFSRRQLGGKILENEFFDASNFAQNIFQVTVHRQNRSPLQVPVTIFVAVESICKTGFIQKILNSIGFLRLVRAGIDAIWRIEDVLSEIKLDTIE